MAEKTTTVQKLKVFAGMEAVVFFIALALPITPSKTGRPFHWPATWAEYFDKVIFSFGLGNAVLIVIFVVGWLFIRSGIGAEGDTSEGAPQTDPAAVPGEKPQLTGVVGSDTPGLSPEDEFKPHGGQFHGDH